MFTFLSRFRRQTAVLTALALVASVLVSVPVSAADDPPKPSYEATFTACLDIPDAEFTDVLDGHANAGDINCIAYYGITMGTGDGSTYSPLMSVTREQMALFLIRLAERVGIEMVSDPADPGFTDIGDLDDESQTAIAQLADLDITKGNNVSGTTYGPSDPVTRGQMALLIARLMDKMTPMTDGNDDAGDWGYTPADVEKNEDVDENGEDAHIGSPFTDLDRVTKETYDAITNLYELGVASGASGHDTAYGPTQQMTRASMAGFMAGVLNHSNTRPAGVSMQATTTEGFGSVSASIVVSYRDASFVPMVDMSLAIFTATAAGSFDEDTGKCANADACEWTDSEFLTNKAGNHVLTGNIETDDGTGSAGNMTNSETWYAWMGDDENSDFVKDSSGEASVTLTANPNALGIRVSTDLNENANANTVHFGKDQSVVITAQLVDEISTSNTIADANAVAKADVELTVTYLLGGTAARPAPAPVKTDADGKATFTITHPGDDDTETDDTDQTDTVTFTGDVDGATGGATESGQIIVIWSDNDPAITNAASSVDSSYAIINDGEVSIRATASFFDQFGNAAAAGEDLTITFTNDDASADGGTDTKNGEVRSNGAWSTRGTVTAAPGQNISVTFSAVGGQTPDEKDVMAVRHARRRDATSGAGAVTAYADDNRFRYTTAAADDGIEIGNLYSYDADDLYIVDGKSSDMAAFEEAIEATGTTVQVVSYRIDDSSIFSASTS